MSFPTSRKYPRTLKEAFPQDDIEWFEPHEKRNPWWAVGAWLFVLFVVFVLFAS